MKVAAAVAAILLSLVPSTSSAQEFELNMRAFIPNEHPTNPGYVRPVPEPSDSQIACDDADALCNVSLPEFMIPGPGVPYISNGPIPLVGSCYNTDDRGFDPYSRDSKGLSRISFTYRGGSLGDVEVKNHTGRSIRLNCATAAVECVDRASSNGITVMPALIGTKINISVNADVSNPCAATPEALTPSIKWNGTFTIDTVAKTVRFEGTIAGFPSYEAYLSVDSEDPVAVFQESPAPGSTAWSLLTTRQLDVAKPYRESPPEPVQPPKTVQAELLGTWRRTEGDLVMTWNFLANGRVSEQRTTPGNIGAAVWGSWTRSGSTARVQFGTTRIYDVTIGQSQISATRPGRGTSMIWMR